MKYLFIVQGEGETIYIDHYALINVTLSRS